MAPTLLQGAASGTQHLRRVSHSLSSQISSLSSRAAAADGSSQPALVSVFALILTKSNSLSTRAASAFSEIVQTSTDAQAANGPLPVLHKRQTPIFAIPLTYKGLNDGPQPGAVVGIVLGSVGGFILCLYILLLTLTFVGGRETIIKEEIITTTRHRSRSRSRSRGTARHSVVMSERPPPPAAPSRRSSRRETVIVEEHIRTHSPEEVIVIEHDSPETSYIGEEEIVEVIEENTTISSRSSHTPPPVSKPPSRRESRKSGFRTVDPAEFGGGSGRMRNLSRRS